MIRVQIRARAEDVSLLQNVQTGYEPEPVGTRDSFAEGKTASASEADQSPYF